MDQHAETAFHQLPGLEFLLVPELAAQHQDIHDAAQHDAANQNGDDRPNAVAYAETAQKEGHRIPSVTTPLDRLWYWIGEITT